MTALRWPLGLLAWTMLVLTALAPLPAAAHEVRPAYLEISEVSAGRYEVVWKTPMVQNRRLRLDPLFPAACTLVGEPVPMLTGDALVERFGLDCGPDGLSTGTLRIMGLEKTLTDVLMRIDRADGDSLSHMFRPESPALELGAAGASGLASYVRLGIEHILYGFDHVLFVLALLFFVPRLGMLIKTITAFTIAHSITLALSAVNLVALPPGPVEAVIALSILFLAVELAHGLKGRRSLTHRAPWIVAFAFGLLHGFGFAGALRELGLPPDATLPALFLFNVGVEIGQLMIVLPALAVAWLTRHSWQRLPQWGQAVPIFLLGITAAAWFWDRLLPLL